MEDAQIQTADENFGSSGTESDVADGFISRVFSVVAHEKFG